MRHSSTTETLRCTLTACKCSFKPSPATIAHVSSQHPPWSAPQAERCSYNATPALCCDDCEHCSMKRTPATQAQTPQTSIIAVPCCRPRWAVTPALPQKHRHHCSSPCSVLQDGMGHCSTTPAPPLFRTAGGHQALLHRAVPRCECACIIAASCLLCVTCPPSALPAAGAPPCACAQSRAAHPPSCLQCRGRTVRQEVVGALHRGASSAFPLAADSQQLLSSVQQYP